MLNADRGANRTRPTPATGSAHGGTRFVVLDGHVGDFSPARLVHDLRRTAARDFRRRGVSEGEIMKLCGWKTRAMFDRYNIIDEADLAEAVAKWFTDQHRQTKGQTTANTGTPTAPLSPLSSSPA